MTKIIIALSAAGDWWEELSETEQHDYLERHLNSRRRMTKVSGGKLKRVRMVATNKVYEKVKALGKTYRHGMRGFRDLVRGRRVAPSDNAALKKTAGVVAGLLLAGVIGLAAFTPLGGLALDVGKEYLDYVRGSSARQEATSAAGGRDSDKDSLLELHRGMAIWLDQQNPEELAATINAKRRDSSK